MRIQRRCGRWSINRHCKIRLEGALAFAACKVTDISLIGAQLSMPLRLAKDKFINLSLYVSDDCILDVEAWIVWRRTIDGENIYGLYFTKIKDYDKDKIYQFVRRNFPGQLNQRWWQDTFTKEGGEEMKDRRIFERFPLSCSLKFLELDSNREGYARAHDICAKGIRMVTKEELSPGSNLELWVEIPDQGEPLYIRGKVAWSEFHGLGGYRAGVNLEKADLMGLSRALRTV